MPTTAKQPRQKVTTAQIQNADWENSRDVDLARDWDITRERARQLRQQYGGPCALKHKSSTAIKIIEWLATKPNLWGKDASEVMAAIKIPTSQSVKRNAMLASDIQFNWD